MAVAEFALAAARTTAGAVAATPSDPCSIPMNLVTRALEVRVVRTSPVVTDGMKSCTFRTAARMPYATIAVSRQATVAAAAALYRIQTGFAAGSAAGKPLTVRGIGDRAAVLDGLLYVRSGTALYQFGIVRYGPQLRPLPDAQRLAKDVLAAVKP